MAQSLYTYKYPYEPWYEYCMVLNTNKVRVPYPYWYGTCHGMCRSMSEAVVRVPILSTYLPTAVDR